VVFRKYFGRRPKGGVEIGRQWGREGVEDVCGGELYMICRGVELIG
jgi:hypothetical protein